MERTRVFAGIRGFDWDEHNSGKIWRQHGVTPRECEEVFLLAPRVAEDPRHSGTEIRRVAFGPTAIGRRLAVVFTQRGDRIRVVTARDQSRRERKELFDDSTPQADSALP